MIALGVIAAVWLTGRRFEQRRIGTTDDVASIAFGAVAGAAGIAAGDTAHGRQLGLVGTPGQHGVAQLPVGQGNGHLLPGGRAGGAGDLLAVRPLGHLGFQALESLAQAAQGLGVAGGDSAEDAVVSHEAGS